MDSEKYIGLDVHQATIVVAVTDSAGRLVMESILETKAATILQFFCRLARNFVGTCRGMSRMRHTWTAILLLLPFVIGHAGRAQDRIVLLAAHRTGDLEVLDPDTLLPFGSIKVLPLADGVVGGSEGMVFLRDGIGPDFNGCCALYALDLKTRNMTKLLDATSTAVVVSPDGEHVITTRGNGIESFSVHTLQREPGIPRSIAPGVYGSLCFSRDGRLLFGASNFPAPTSTLDVFDFNRRTLVRRFALPEELAIVGACADNAYYLLGVSIGHRKASSQLWRVKADGSAIGTPVSINFPDTTSECEFHAGSIVVAGDLLFLAESFGGKADLPASCDRKLNGGVLLVDPQTGQVKNRFAPELHFGQLISSADGKEIYGIDVRDPTWKAVGLVLLDSASGRILARRDLGSDRGSLAEHDPSPLNVWHLALATISPTLVPQGHAEAVAK